MASLQARHSRSCAIGRPWTTAEAVTGCTCRPGPMFHVVSRVDGRLVREPVGHNRKLAERALRKVQVQLEENTYQVPRAVSFADWADRWLDGLRRQHTTRQTYASTLGYAKAVFGAKP